MTKEIKRFLTILMAAVVIATIVIVVFNGYIPVKYNYKVGSVATGDIFATRNVNDNFQTEYNAVMAKNSVKTVMIRSDVESENNISRVKSLFQLIRQGRAGMMDEFGIPTDEPEKKRDDLVKNIKASNVKLDISPDDAMAYLNMSKAAFDYLEKMANSITEIVMIDIADEDTLKTLLNDNVKSIFESENSFEAYKDLLLRTLTIAVKPNASFNMEATSEAADNAYNQVMNDPVVIAKGTKIVSSGQVITEHDFRILSDLELISDDSFDFLLLIRVALYVFLISFVLYLYFVICREKLEIELRMFIALSILFVIPVIVGYYVSDLSTQAVAILFFTTICSAFMGSSDGIVLSVFLLMYMWPIYNFDYEFLVTSFVCIIVCATLAASKKNGNMSILIISTTLSAAAASVIVNFISGSALTNDFIVSAGWTSLSALLSVVAAIGLMPVFELMSGSVSPIKLINLSLPSQPLLKRLFIEAPGTSQHSMMVANLAESAAEEIGADPLLCRVAAYYHDIGKLKDPSYFTENQKEYNPHDVLTAKESVEIIKAHVTDGVSMAKEARLPKSIVDIIGQHHGNSTPSFFYKRAIEEAKMKGLPEPDKAEFSYNAPVPQTREAAIVMLADTCEAAIKSSKSTDINEVEALIRKLIKHKIEDDQLVCSDLSFNEVETVIKAFVGIYAGQFHERISYPK